MGSNEDEKKNHVFTWKIENFSMCSLEKGESLRSCTFKAKSFDETSWYLCFYPRGHFKSADGYTACCLKRAEDDAVSLVITCDFIIEIIDKNGHSVQRLKDDDYEFEKGQNYGWHNYMKRDELLKTALYDDTLIIRCRLFRNMPVLFSSSQNNSTTTFKIRNHSFKWVVRSLNYFPPPEEVMKLFCLGSSQIKVVIGILDDYVKIYIQIDENISSSQLILSNFTLLDVEGKERDSRRATHLFKKSEKWEFPNFIKKSLLNADRDIYLKDDCFTLQCDFSLSDGSIVEDIDEKGELSPANKYTFSDVDSFAVLSEDIKRMYEDKIHTDITLKVGNELFPAHKSILCARSPVFLAMFDNDMTESQKGEVDISDLDAKTMDLFLKYMYTGTVNDLEYDNATKLIVSADKYQVLLLKNKCAEFLTSMLTDANVCEILFIADLVQHDTLKAAAFENIKKQPHKILNSDEWKHWVKNNLELATETICEVTKSLFVNQSKE